MLFRSSDGKWMLGPTLAELGAAVERDSRLRRISIRPLMDLAFATGALTALSVEDGPQTRVVEVLPGTRRLAFEPKPGMAWKYGESVAGLDIDRLAVTRALVQARIGDVKPVVDPGAGHPAVCCIAAPLPSKAGHCAAIWLMLPGGDRVPNAAVTATQRTAHRITAAMARTFPDL